LAGELPEIRSYTVRIYRQLWPTLHAHPFMHTMRTSAHHHQVHNHMHHHVHASRCTLSQCKFVMRFYYNTVRTPIHTHNRASAHHHHVHSSLCMLSQICDAVLFTTLYAHSFICTIRTSAHHHVHSLICMLSQCRCVMQFSLQQCTHVQDVHVA